MFSVIAAVILGVSVFTAAGAVTAWWNAGPNYRLAPTASCLRAYGYSSLRIRRGSGDWNYPGLWVSRSGDYLMSVYFTPSADAAGRALTGMSDSIGARRNVATNLEVAGTEENQVLACLRT